MNNICKKCGGSTGLGHLCVETFEEESSKVADQDPWSDLTDLCKPAFKKYIEENGITISTEYGSAFLAAKLAFVSGWESHALAVVRFFTK
jgi:hypothetical protein